MPDRFEQELRRVKNIHTMATTTKLGAGGGDRTPDPLITNHVRGTAPLGLQQYGAISGVPLDSNSPHIEQDFGQCETESRSLDKHAVTILLTKGYVALIDLEDLERVSAYGWIAAVNRGGRVYAKAHPIGEGKRARKKIYMHRLIVGAQPGQLVDHVSGMTLDNRRSNLRICTSSQNQMNRKATSRDRSSRYKGVGWDKKRQCFSAGIGIDGKCIYLGLYRTDEDAARAYDAGARKYFAEYAKLNFPDEFIVPDRLDRNPISKAGIRGVYPYKGRFTAMISRDGKQIHLGVFDTTQEAAAAREEALRTGVSRWRVRVSYRSEPNNPSVQHKEIYA